MSSLTLLAPAKVNLFLHVGPVDAEDYHPIASLVAFADVGDRLTARRAERLDLQIVGEFAGGLGNGPDNLILRALHTLGQVTGIGDPGLELVLDKVLPIAAGLGGGSSDAGAALRLVAEYMGEAVTKARLLAVAETIGADGPMCLNPVSTWAEGRGGWLEPEPRLPPLHAVLVNPRAPSSTGAVYRAYDAGVVAQADRPAPPTDWTAKTVIDWLGQQRNDLEAPALSLQPAIGPVLEAVARTDSVGLTRMSGSGATVFGLFVDGAAADHAAERLLADHDNWWIKRTTLGSGPR